MNNNRELIGKIFFTISIFSCIYFLISPLTSIFIHIDEMFTINLINLDLNNLISLIISDVHPPLYYFILMFIHSINNLFFYIDELYISKFVSILPCILLLLFSYTKIRKEYGWLTTGLMTFAITFMTPFYIQFLTVRMYSWGLLFLLLSYVYIKDVICSSNYKSWALFTIFVILSSYTHNILLITLGLMYLLLFVYFLKINKIELKKWFLSVIVTFISYIPWLFNLLLQMGANHGSTGAASLSLSSLLSYLTSYITYFSDDIFIGFSLIFLIFMIFVALNKYFHQRNVENFYVIVGMLLFIFTIVIGAFILPLFFNPLVPRYLIPVCSILWLSFSILIGRLDNNNLCLILVLCVLFFGVFGQLYSHDITEKYYDEGLNEKNFLDEINIKNSVVVYASGYNYYCYHLYLNNTKQYMLHENEVQIKNSPYTVQPDLKKIVKSNPDKDIYVIKGFRTNKDWDFLNGLNYTVKCQRGSELKILKINV